MIGVVVQFTSRNSYSLYYVTSDITIQRMSHEQVGEQATRWIFVYNNAPALWKPPFDASRVKYMIWQREKGETEHVQGYLRFARKTRFNAVIKYLAEGHKIHVEIAKGSEKQNKEYCSKEETRVDGPWELGVYDEKAGVQGRRVDLEAVADLIKQGRSLKEVALDHPATYIRYSLGLEKYQQLVQPLPPLERVIAVTVLWGATGTGKTHRVRTGYPDAFEVIAARDPFGSYSQQDCILFDEYNYTKWSIQDMNRYTDKWRCQLDCRYHNKYAAWTHVFICSNTEPYTWWPEEHQSLREAFWRRVHSIHVRSIEQELLLSPAQIPVSSPIAVPQLMPAPQRASPHVPPFDDSWL